MNLNDKLILLTGATGGIGQAIAKRLVAQGARLILVSRSEVNLNSLAQELNIALVGGFVLQADIASRSGRETIRTALLALQEPIDAIINCAGINLFGMIQDSDPEAIEELISTNVTATILLTRLTLPFLNKRNGRIINIGSSFGGLGYPGFSVYCASKFALRGFSEALRRELSDGSLQVAYIAPRATNTNINSAIVRAMNKDLRNSVDEPDVVALVVEITLTSKKMRDQNIGLPERLFLKINSIFPGIIDSALHRKLAVIRRYAQDL